MKKNSELVEEVNQMLKKHGELPIVKATDLVKKNPDLVRSEQNLREVRWTTPCNSDNRWLLGKPSKD